MAKSIRKRVWPLARRFNLDLLIRLSGQHHIFPFYHVVSDWHLPHIRHLYRYKRANEFENDLEELLKWFEPLSFDDYLKQKREGGGSQGRGKRSMVLSFDDGLIECHQIIAPILRKKGVPAAFFLNNHFIDNKGLFYRYKASLIIDTILSDCKAREKISEYLVIPEEQVVKALGMVSFAQQSLLDELARLVELDFVEIISDDPVYMNKEQVREIVEWGFEIGGHSLNHPDFSSLAPEDMVQQVKVSTEKLQLQFGVSTRFFSFPFTSDGIPESVIDSLLNIHRMDVLLGTAGLKKTGKAAFIQRIPMEDFEMSALEALKSEYLWYWIKQPLGKNSTKY